MATKTYQHLRMFEHLTAVELENGQRYTVHFRNGVQAPRLIRGTFTTSIPAVMMAMDKDERNGKLWKCVRGKDVDVASLLKSKSVSEDTAPAKPTPAPPAREPEALSVVEVSGITTAKDAKEYLESKMPDIDWSGVTTKQQFLSKAAELGYAFPGIKQ